MNDQPLTQKLKSHIESYFIIYSFLEPCLLTEERFLKEIIDQRENKGEQLQIAKYTRGNIKIKNSIFQDFGCLMSTMNTKSAQELLGKYVELIKEIESYVYDKNDFDQETRSRSYSMLNKYHNFVMNKRNMGYIVDILNRSTSKKGVSKELSYTFGYHSLIKKWKRNVIVGYTQHLFSNFRSYIC